MEILDKHFATIFRQQLPDCVVSLCHDAAGVVLFWKKCEFKTTFSLFDNTRPTS